MRNSFEDILRNPDERSSAAGGNGTEAQQQSDFEKIISDKVGTLNKEALREDTLRFGAKGANLNLLSSIVDKVSSVVGRYQPYTVPEYQLVPVSVYEKRDVETDFTAAVENIFSWVNGRSVIIRSSAVYSEDAENLTGAGIYKSLVLDANASRDQLVEKIREVYASVDSAEAIKYRADHGIPEEKMGLVVQEFFDCKPGEKGYVNSIVKNVPNLMEIAYSDGIRPLVVKEKVRHSIVDFRDEQSIMHYEPDSNRVHSVAVRSTARIVATLEQYYGQPLQVEFLQSTRDHGLQTYLVQARFLPNNFSEKKSFEFPQQEALFEGRAVGAFDVTLPILSLRDDNSEREGVVIFTTSKFFQMGGPYRHLNREDRPDLLKSIPQKGGAIVLSAPIEDCGHVETLCAERGVALIFSSDAPKPAIDKRSETEKASDEIREAHKIDAYLDKLWGYDKFRLVSDGLEGRVYGVKEEQSDE